MPMIFQQDIVKFTDALREYSFPDAPRTLYEPIEYILSLGGKRIRPAMVLATARLLDGDSDAAMHAAMAVEVFHNFTLMHDDIMDAADYRRGQTTVHLKYNVNTAILSGDVMLIYAYKLLERLPQAMVAPSLKVFNDMAEKVCIGQQMDVDFETADDVEIMSYIKMIECKTSVLLGLSIQLGGIVSGCNEQDLFHLYEFGKNIGIAFQIQDDILDTFGDFEKVGKTIGGDILNNKKTYLYLKSLQLLDDKNSKALRDCFSKDYDENKEKKIEKVTYLFNQAGVKVYAEELKSEYLQLAISHLNAVQSMSDLAIHEFGKFSSYLIKRTQ